jgi:Fic family protein
MRFFSYETIPKELITSEVMNMIAAIHEYKGRQELFIAAQPDILSTLLEIAKVQSAGASNRIEGIDTTEDRLNDLVKRSAEPKNRPEREIAGYRDVLALIHESYDYMPPRANVILQLHRDLCKYLPAGSGGAYKNADNVIAEVAADGSSVIRFKPLSAFETPDAMERLTGAFINGINAGSYDPLLLIPMFVLDFLCIHPFNDGNGRMSRLLTLLLLYRSGYIAGKYISIEMLIEKTKETYYDALAASSVDWHTGGNSYVPFVEYFLGILLAAYREFSERVDFVQNRSLSKPDRIRSLFANTLQRLSKKGILEKCPDISLSTIEATLALMVKEGSVVKTGTGKNTAYIRNTEPGRRS